jgi:hypothetical protein
MKAIFYLATVLILGAMLSCGKSTNSTVTSGNVKETVETKNAITYKSFVGSGISSFKGILVMGSGNDENNPTAGILDESTDVDLCTKAAQNGYVAAIVQYRKTPGLADWNTSAQEIGEDYNSCITALSAEFNVNKNNSVVGGYSYASFMLLTNSAYYDDLSYCKGLLAPCGGTDATEFKIPIFAIACSGNNEGDYSGKELYEHIDPNSPIKAESSGVTDNSCNTHCGGNWTNQLYAKMVSWMP